MKKINLHNQDDTVNYNPNGKWVYSSDTKDKIKLRKVPFMNTGKHLPRYDYQKELVSIYMNYQGDEMIQKLVEYFNN
tara:strand:- start:383 stop:613 length:231 start_codon:yes stop_codon:yes gene_type:complete